LQARIVAKCCCSAGDKPIRPGAAGAYLPLCVAYFTVGRLSGPPQDAIPNVLRDLRMEESTNSASGSAPVGPVPKAVASRLSLYLRELQHLIEQGEETTSSSQLGRKLGFTDAQVRKDLAYFGHFGYPGIGYRCDKLVGAIKRILGTDQQWAAVLVGAGNLGRALLGYKGFGRQGFRVAGAFDTDAEKIGTSIEGVVVYHLDQLSDFAKANRVRLGIIAVPAPAAQTVANRLVAAGVEGILNFAPVTIELPDNVRQVGVDLAIELEQLSFAIVSRAENAGG
jgi:redox-sensing transcriptional repressor